MDKIITRPATFADMDTLLRFEQGVITAERPFDSTLKDAPINYYDLVGIIERPDIELLVAELNGELTVVLLNQQQAFVILSLGVDSTNFFTSSMSRVQSTSRPSSPAPFPAAR